MLHRAFLRTKLVSLLLSVVPVLLFLLAPVLSAAESQLTRTQIARLESLCRVWGTVKFFHPWIVAPPDGKSIDWDAALIETIPLVEKASSPEEFSAAVNHLLGALHDRATRASSQNRSDTDNLPQSRSAIEPASPISKVVETAGKKFLAIDATAWISLAAYQRKSPSELFIKPFAEAADKDAIVLDLRRQGGSLADATAVVAALRDGLATLLSADLALAARRSRFHSGYAPEQGNTSGGYYSGFTLSEPTILAAKPGPSAGKRLIVLTNSGASQAAPLLAALQSTGQAVVLHHADGVEWFAPSGPTYTLNLGEGVVANIRTADPINADGTFGLTPDVAKSDKPDENSDPLWDIALAIASGQTTPPPRLPKRLPATPSRVIENAYPEMKMPSREYRLLGLFRVWNVMHYFFPYKHLMDRSWDSVLTEFIPRFADADNPPKLGFAIREVLAHLQDSHVNATGGGPLNAALAQLGFASPPILLQWLGDEVVVVAAHDSVTNSVQVGDVVLAVDGQSVAQRSARTSKYVAASTPQALHRRLSGDLLRGQLGSPAILKLRSMDGTVREESIPRPPNAESAPAFRALFEARQRKTPVFSVVPEGYGYFDLIRLTVPEVNSAFDAVKGTPALIMDMRGYPQGTAWAICARLTDKPMTMAAFRRHYWTSPFGSEDRWAFDQRIQPSPLWKYTGRIVVLINEDAISQSEHSCLGFEEAAKGRITFIGTSTTGANGDVTNTSMPGGIRISFSGHDVRHADGRQLQRLGIQPDIRVEPTIAGIVAGKDEVLEAAINFLSKSKAE